MKNNKNPKIYRTKEKDPNITVYVNKSSNPMKGSIIKQKKSDEGKEEHLKLKFENGN